MTARRPGAGIGWLRAPPVVFVLWLSVVGWVAGPGIPGAYAASEEPRLEWRQGRLRVSRLPDPTLDERALKHLESGLTTSLVVRAFVRGADGETLRSEGWMAVRWDLWDEVFEVASRGLWGSGRRQLSGRDALSRWWRDLSFALPDVAPGADGVVRLEIDLLPFSRAEEEDARRWLSDALRREPPTAGEAAEGATAEGPEPLTNVLNLLMATSVRREPVVRWRWRLEVPEGEP